MRWPRATSRRHAQVKAQAQRGCNAPDKQPQLATRYAFSSEAGRPHSYAVASHSTQTCRHSGPSPMTAPYQNRTNSTKAGHEGAARGTTRVPKEWSHRRPRPVPCRLICLDTPPAPTNTRTEQTCKLHTPASAVITARGHQRCTPQLALTSTRLHRAHQGHTATQLAAIQRALS